METLLVPSRTWRSLDDGTPISDVDQSCQMIEDEVGNLNQVSWLSIDGATRVRTIPAFCFVDRTPRAGADLASWFISDEISLLAHVHV